MKKRQMVMRMFNYIMTIHYWVSVFNSFEPYIVWLDRKVLVQMNLSYAEGFPRNPANTFTNLH